MGLKGGAPRMERGWGMLALGMYWGGGSGDFLLRGVPRGCASGARGGGVGRDTPVAGPAWVAGRPPLSRALGSGFDLCPGPSGRSRPRSLLSCVCYVGAAWMLELCLCGACAAWAWGEAVFVLGFMI